MLLFECVQDLPGKRILEIGTGTGFIAIMLAKTGKKVVGVDIHPRAVLCAKENAESNAAQVNFFESDLFELIADKYDVIVSNPPYGSLPKYLAGALEFLKSLVPREYPLVSSVGFFFSRSSRRQWIRRLMEGARMHLDEGGVLVVILHQKELEEFSKPFYGVALGSAHNLHAVLFDRDSLPSAA